MASPTPDAPTRVSLRQDPGRRAAVDGGYQQQLLLVLKDRRRRLRLLPTGTAQPD
jgi:hypothetical protein